MPPSDTDTGLSFIARSNVDPYLATSSRFEGSTTAQKLISLPPGPILSPIASTST
jgi:simple sugar transport system substrate-binding protein